MSDERPERDDREIDLFFERAREFQEFVAKAGNAPRTEMRIAVAMFRMMLPGLDESVYTDAQIEISEHVGIKVKAQ